ncbi:MAG: hypothetical protein ABII07_00185 [Patescibacteria group bacterium]|nr:hypothetical protein [Patescibacteria group bacterium]
MGSSENEEGDCLFVTPEQRMEIDAAVCSFEATRRGPNRVLEAQEITRERGGRVVTGIRPSSGSFLDENPI